MLAISKIVLFIFVSTSEDESDNALTEVRIIRIQLYRKPAMGFSNEYNVTTSESEEQRAFMKHSQ